MEIDSGVKIDIDVIIPVWNGEKYIAAAINSVVEQTYPPKRIIVVNDGSTDDTERIILDCKKNSSIEIEYVKKDNGGLSSARNAGLAVSRSEWVSFLDADDEWFPDKLEMQVNVLRSTPYENIGVVYGRYKIIDENGELNGDIPLAFPDPDIRGDVFKKVLVANKIIGSGSAVLIKKECFKYAGNFDETLRAAEDWDMWLRIAEKYEFDFSDGYLVKIRFHSSNMQKNKWHMFENELNFYRKWALRLSEKGLRCPSLWAKMISLKIILEYPDVEFHAYADNFLGSEVRKSIFWFTFGSLRLMLSVAVIYVFITNVISIIKSLLSQCLKLIREVKIIWTT